MDVNALLKALQTTLRFEQEMASRFGAPTPAPADDELETTYLRNAQVRTYTIHHCAAKGIVGIRRDIKWEFCCLVLYFLC